MAASRNYFGTDGIRGVANQSPLDPETMVRLGKAIARVFSAGHRRHRVLIGKDTRLSGYMLEQSLAAGITSMGLDVTFSGPVPTPGVAYLTKSMRADAGVMISASHNPYEDNGIKIFAADGFKLPDATESKLEELLQPGVLDAEHAAPAEIGKAFRMEDALGRYTVYLKECFPRDLTLDGVRMAFDGANGAGYVVGPQTFRELGAEVSAVGVSPNGRNINAGCGSLHPDVVRGVVGEQRLDFGIALDGDGDRAVIVDDRGTILDGDAILAICARDLKDRGYLAGNTVVATVMSNLGLERYLKRHGISLLRAQVGDRYVLEEMQRVGATLGGEQSGHVIFSHFSTTGDGILTALMVLSVMARSGKRLSELNDGFERYPQRTLNVRVRAKPPIDSLPELARLIASKTAALGDTGRILVRYSGTEPKLRVMVECESESRCSSDAEEIAAAVQSAIGVAGGEG